MPRKIRELEADLKRAGFVNHGGKGSHRVYKHAKGVAMTMSGQGGDDAQRWQERDVRKAIEESKS